LVTTKPSPVCTVGAGRSISSPHIQNKKSNLAADWHQSKGGEEREESFSSLPS